MFGIHHLLLVLSQCLCGPDFILWGPLPDPVCSRTMARRFHVSDPVPGHPATYFLRAHRSLPSGPVENLYRGRDPRRQHLCCLLSGLVMLDSGSTMLQLFSSRKKNEIHDHAEFRLGDERRPDVNATVT